MSETSGSRDWEKQNALDDITRSQCRYTRAGLAMRLAETEAEAATQQAVELGATHEELNEATRLARTIGRIDKIGRP